jgi:hypothetical protein
MQGDNKRSDWLFKFIGKEVHNNKTHTILKSNSFFFFNFARMLNAVSLMFVWLSPCYQQTYVIAHIICNDAV